MKEIDNKYILPTELLALKIIEVLDFQDYPILNLVSDQFGQKFLSTILKYDNEYEYRGILQVSETNLKSFLNGLLYLDKIYKNIENKIIYIGCYRKRTGKLEKLFGLPSDIFNEKYKIEEDYLLLLNDSSGLENNIELNNKLGYAKDRKKIIFDIYLSSKELKNDIKLWALDRVLNPTIEIVKSILEMDTQLSYKKLAVSDIRLKSLGASIEIDYDWELFDDIKQIGQIEQIFNLFNARTKDELTKVLITNKNERFIKEYSRILNTIVNKDAKLATRLINPQNDNVKKSTLDKTEAIVVKKIIDETFPQITDVEDIIGLFLEIDYTKKEPTFSIQTMDEQKDIIHGKIHPDIVEYLKKDKINFCKDEYNFTIKTIYTPATSFKEEFSKNFLIKYEAIIK